MTAMNMNADVDSPLNLTECVDAAGIDSPTMTAGFKVGKCSAEPKVSPRRILTNTSSSGSG